MVNIVIMKDKKREDNILICPNPVAIAPASQGQSGGLMPPEIHGGGLVESVEKESTIDYPVSKGLCREIWISDKNGNWSIDESIKQRALELVDKLLARYHVKATGVNVVGSICSNQYGPDSDVDVHIQVDLPEDVVEKLNTLRKKEQDKLFENEDLMVGQSKTHPLEFYFQSNIYADMGSCGCYDLMNDKWLSGPQFVNIEFDPFDEYCQSFDEAVEFGHRVSNALFDLQKNLYKYNAILDQASNEDVYKDDQMMALIGRRLEDVVEDVVESMRIVSELKEEMVQVRKRANLKPKDEKEADDMRTNKEWLSANSTFKFLQRMDVLDSCWEVSDIYSKYESGEITDQNYIVSELNNSDAI